MNRPAGGPCPALAPVDAAAAEAALAALQVDGLGVAHAVDGVRVSVVEGLALGIAPGRTCALVGESGCGKTSAALALLRLLPDTAAVTGGRVCLGGTELLRLPEHRMRCLRGRRIAMVFQDSAASLDPVMRIGAQVREVVVQHTLLRGRAAQAEALAWLERVGLPDAARRYHDHPHRLSGGERQRVMIAIALAGGPDVLVADEPTAGLDGATRAQVIDLLRSLQQARGLALLLITHDLETVAAMAGQVALMYAGQVVETAPADRFFAGPCHPYGRALLRAMPGTVPPHGLLPAIAGRPPAPGRSPAGCRYAPRCDRAVPACAGAVPLQPAPSGDPASAVRCVRPVGPGDPWQAAVPSAGAGFRAGADADAAGASPEPPAAAAEGSAARGAAATPLLEVRALRVRYRRSRGGWVGGAGWPAAVVDGVSFRVGPGETLALVGPSGCGKSTVARAVTGLLRGQAQVDGRVLVAGVDLAAARGPAMRQARRTVQIVFQHPAASFDPRLSVGESLSEGVQALCPELDGAGRRSAVLAALDQVGLDGDVLARRPHAFSGGQQQRLSIARALAVGPRLIVCDEPTSALDISVQAQLLNLLQSLQRTCGLAYLLVTHDMAVVRHMAHRVMSMSDGRVVERPSP